MTSMTSKGAVMINFCQESVATQGWKLTPARMPRALTFLAGQVKPTNSLPVWASSQLTIGQVGPQASPPRSRRASRSSIPFHS